MRLTNEEEYCVSEILKPYQENEQVQSLKKFVQHGAVSTFDHCHNVAKMCFWMNRHFNLKVDEEALVVGAFLHDFYLYDWHKKNDGHNLHGFTHPNVACDNAVKHFGIGQKEQHIIKTHMWPLTLLKFPRCKEAWLVSVVDKYCSVVETLNALLSRS